MIFPTIACIGFYILSCSNVLSQDPCQDPNSPTFTQDTYTKIERFLRDPSFPPPPESLTFFKNIEDRIYQNKLTHTDKQLMGQFINWLENKGCLDGIPDDAANQFLKENTVKQFADSLGNLKDTGVTAEEIYTLFNSTIPEEQFRSPVLLNGLTFLIPKGLTPSSKGSPRRHNFKKLWNGDAPSTRVCVNLADKFETLDRQPETSGVEIVDAHHLAQQDQDKIFLMPKKWHQDHHGKLHLNLSQKSQIDRGRFRTVKKKAYKIACTRMASRMVTHMIAPSAAKGDLTLKNDQPHGAGGV